MPDASASIARLRATSPTCMRRNSSKRSRRCAFRATSIDGGWWTPRYASVRATSFSSPRTSLGERLGQVADPVQCQRDDGLDLPRRHVGLARLRVDRHHDARLRVAGPAEHVDDRVRELTLAAVHVELPVQRDLGARRELLLAPRLVEEHEVQEAAVVLDHGFDHLLALTRESRRHPLHLGDDRRLLTHLEVGDVGLVRAVVVPAWVVTEQVEHRLDRRRQRAELVEHPGREPERRPAASSPGCGACAARGYSTPIRYG